MGPFPRTLASCTDASFMFAKTHSVHAGVVWYTGIMIKLTREQTEQVIRNPDGVVCQGDGTEKTFIIVDAEILNRLKSSLYRQDVHESIAAGIADMEQGRVMTAEAADDRVRSELGFPSRSTS